MTTVVRTISLLGFESGLLMRLADGGLLRAFVAVTRAAGQAPGAALMTPRRAVLQKHGRRTVGTWRAKKQTRRAMQTPVRRPAVGHHPAVAVATHPFSLGNTPKTSAPRMPTRHSNNS